MFARLDHRLAGMFRRLPKCWQQEIEQAYVRLLSVGVGELQTPIVTEEEIAASRQLSVIVPVYNAADDTERCLRSLGRFAGEAEIVVVDDGSEDVRARAIVEQFVARNHWKNRRNATSSFHSVACMVGAELATRPILCLLNSDTVVTQHSWSLCVKALRECRDLMAVGPMTSDGWMIQNDVRARRCRFSWSDEQIFWYAERLHRRHATCRPRLIRPYVTGAAFFMRRRDWERVGGFNGCRHHLGNDVDLSRKLTADGGWVGVCGGAYIHHLGGRSAAPGASLA